MLMVTTEQIAGKKIVEMLGIVRGGANVSYSEQAFQKMSQQAESWGANAIVGVRLQSWGALPDYSGDFEVYGTAVKAE